MQGRTVGSARLTLKYSNSTAAGGGPDLARQQQSSGCVLRAARLPTQARLAHASLHACSIGRARAFAEA